MGASGGFRTDRPDSDNYFPKCKKDKQHEFTLPLNNDSAVLNDALSLENLSLQTSENIESNTIDSNMEKVLQQVLREVNLSERDRFIITGYFNVPCQDRKTEPKSLHQLSTLTGITPERVRQIKEQTLSGLKKELKKQSVQHLAEICL
jgi:DNA-directed RNA polymerase sigma subunit (sigma70/sigma32)